MLIPGSADTLYDQAPKTVAGYFDAAFQIVSSKLGDEFITSHPQLLGQLVTAMASDYATMMLTKAVAELSETIGAFEVVSG